MRFNRAPPALKYPLDAKKGTEKMLRALTMIKTIKGNNSIQTLPEDLSLQTHHSQLVAAAVAEGSQN